MTNLSFVELERSFQNDDFPRIEGDRRGIRFLKLRSMSRKDTMEEFAAKVEIDLSSIPARNYFSHIFEDSTVLNSSIDEFIEAKYKEERLRRLANEPYLVDQLSRLLVFDWGGSHGNSLEKNIVNNYVKRIQSYEKITEEIEGSLLASLRGYTLNSWYNHWTSIVIEDIFKDHSKVKPTVGLVKKIDFFINDIPFDLKVTYFPEELMAAKLKESGYGNELTNLKKICRGLEIVIPDDLGNSELRLHLLKKLSEDPRAEVKEFVEDLRNKKKAIIEEAVNSPSELKKWFYENQGELRFDASNRFFLVLIDESDMSNSWKLKRNVVLLKDKIHSHLDSISFDARTLETSFHWAKTDQTFTCKSDILFVKV